MIINFALLSALKSNFMAIFIQIKNYLIELNFIYFSLIKEAIFCEKNLNFFLLLFFPSTLKRDYYQKNVVKKSF